MTDLGSENFDSMTFPRKKGGNVLGLETRHNMVMWTGRILVRTNQKDYDMVHGKLMALMADIKSYTASVDGQRGLKYMNYADPSQDCLGSYGEENIKFIRQVATKYDSTEMFQERVPGGWKISLAGVKY